MKKLRTGIPFLLLLVGIFAGLGAYILHPYVHVLTHDAHLVETHSDHGQSPAKYSDSADNCYVCIFSKQLVLDGLRGDIHPVKLLRGLNVLIPFSFFSDSDDAVIFLRAPPLG